MAVQDQVPTGDSTNPNTWTSSAGGSKFADVDDAVGAPNDDTDYIHSSTAFGSQQFTFAAFSITSSAVAKITVTMRFRSEAGTQEARARLQVNGTQYTGSTKTMSTTYADYTEDWLTNPNTAAAWAEADVEGTGSAPLQQFGVQLRAFTNTGRCTQTYVSVDYTDAGGGGATPIRRSRLTTLGVH